MHLLIVGWLTLRPLDVPWVSPANLHPLDGIRAALALGPREATVHIGEGTLLLAPLGVLLPLVGGRLQVSLLGSLVRTVAVAALLSLGIELVQTGVPGQVVDVDSLLLNPLGVAVAHLAVVPAARAWLRRKSHDPEVPPEGRQLTDPPENAPATDGRPDGGSQGATRTIPRVRIAP